MKKDKIKILVIVLSVIIILVGICFFVMKRNFKKNNIDRTDCLVEVENEIFADTYKKAQDILDTLSLEEKIGQLFLVRYPEENAKDLLASYKFGGYILFEKDFKNKTKSEVQSELAELKDILDIPLIIAVDEEGGKVVRVSSNSNLTSERFKSPGELYDIGGFDQITQDTIEKSKILYDLGINVNLAPVVDISTNESDYIYQRTLGKDSRLTSIYARTVIEASKEGKVSYTLKHFPGYASNKDTHSGISVDNKLYEEIIDNELLPFRAGVEAGAEAIMVSHNIVTSIDKENPASLSEKVHDMIKSELGFTGVVITDDLDMGAISNIDNAPVKAVLAGNDLIIVTDYEKSINVVRTAVANGEITEEMINKHALQVLAWKYYKYE